MTRRERTFRALAGIISALTLFLAVREGSGMAEGNWLVTRWAMLIGVYLLIALFGLYAIGGQRAVDPVIGWLIKVAELRDRMIDKLIRKYVVMPPEPEHLLPWRKRAGDATLSQPAHPSDDDSRTDP